MQHDGTLLRAVVVGVLQVEVERHLEVELHGAALPGATERIFQMEVDLRAVEGAVALVDLVRHIEPLEGGLQAAFCRCPVLVGAHGIVGTGGKFHMVFEAELLVHRVDEVHDADDFIGELVGAHEQVRVVLS